ncbi:MAG: lectin-like protein [Phycisphaerae bacterium]
MRTTAILPICLLVALTSSAALAAPLLDPANGHYYDVITPPAGISWSAANAAAQSSTFLATPGHLATFSSQSEFDFVTSHFPTNFTWIGFTDQVTEGQFLWVTSQPVNYTRWLLHEPNNSADGNGEDYAFYQQGTLDVQATQGWGWNDYQDVPQIIGEGIPISYAVEYDTPEPTTSMLLLAGLSAAFLHRKLRT